MAVDASVRPRARSAKRLLVRGCSRSGRTQVGAPMGTINAPDRLRQGRFGERRLAAVQTVHLDGRIPPLALPCSPPGPITSRAPERRSVSIVPY